MFVSLFSLTFLSLCLSLFGLTFLALFLRRKEIGKEIQRLEREHDERQAAVRFHGSLGAIIRNFRRLSVMLGSFRAHNL